MKVGMVQGGSAPFRVFEVADHVEVVDAAMTAKMRNIGEACTAANRFHVAEPIAREFAERLAQQMGAMKIGRGTDAGVEVGPLINEDQREKVEELVDDARERGATVLTGGERLDGPGYFYPPTVLGDVPDAARLLKEEIFGPVAPVKGFRSEDEAIRWANNTEYGPVAFVFTSD